MMPTVRLGIQLRTDNSCPGLTVSASECEWRPHDQMARRYTGRPKPAVSEHQLPVGICCGAQSPKIGWRIPACMVATRSHASASSHRERAVIDVGTELLFAPMLWRDLAKAYFVKLLVEIASDKKVQATWRTGSRRPRRGASGGSVQAMSDRDLGLSEQPRDQRRRGRRTGKSVPLLWYAVRR